MRRRRWLALLVLLALVLAIPLLVNLEIFRDPVHRALERQLGRQVEFGSLTARLLPRPGMIARRVMVHESEGFGAEPFLYAEEVYCGLSARLLWTGRLECSSIHFARPSINLVRNSKGAWNLAAFLLPPTQAMEDDAPVPTHMPVLSVADGRINIKLGADKQLYALTDVQMRAEASGEGRWRLRIRATPVHLDRRLSETGRLNLEGEFGRAREFSALPFRVQLRLDRGSLAQLWTLFWGHEPPLRALASFAATLDGTPADWKAQGSMTIENLHRWDLVAPAGSPRWRFEFNLKIGGREPAVEIVEATLSAAASRLQVTGRVADPFGDRRWELRTTSGRLWLDELMAQLAGLKRNVSTEARFDGVLDVDFSAQGPFENWRGVLTAPEKLSFHVPGSSPPVELDGLQLFLERGGLRLEPVALRFGPEDVLTLRGEVQRRRTRIPYRLHWESPGVELELLRRAAAVFGWDFFGSTRWQGRAEFDLDWRGNLLSREEPGWQGRVELRGVKFHPPELNHPLEIVEARVGWKKGRVEVNPLVVRLGEQTIEGALERRGRTGRWNVSVSEGRLRLADLDNLLNPARRGLLVRLMGQEPRRPPRWDQLDAAGQVKLEELQAGPFHLRRVRMQGEWQSGWLEFTRLRFRAYEGRFVGRFQGNFRTSPPQFRLAGNLRDVRLGELLAGTTGLGDLFQGRLGAELTLQAEGTSARQLRHSLRGRVVGGVNDGTIAHVNFRQAMAAASGVALAEPTPETSTKVQGFSGEFRVANEQAQVEGARLTTQGAALEISGRIGFDGRLDLTLNGEPLRVVGRRSSPALTRLLSHSYRLTGTLRQPDVRLADTLPGVAEADR